MTVPVVSVLMVARNAASFIDAAIHSARAQTFTDIEIVIVDDGSSDATVQLAKAHAMADDRVHLLDGPCKGLSAVRNVSLGAARGRFAVILDSDDLLDPRHIERLVADQARDEAPVCVTNMVEFQQDHGLVRSRIFAQGVEWRTARTVGPAEFARCGMIGTREVSLGYLKPLFDLRFLRSHALNYDERLRVGEDFDLVMRAMLSGARYRFLPQATYFYRKHPASTSHRLASEDIRSLIDATRGYAAYDRHLDELLQSRMKNLEGARRQVEALDALRCGRLIEAIRLVAPNSAARALLLSSLRESVLKRLERRHAAGLFRAASGEAAEPADDPTVMLRALQTATPSR